MMESWKQYHKHPTLSNTEQKSDLLLDLNNHVLLDQNYLQI